MNDSEEFTYAVRHLRDLIRAELDEQVESQRDYLEAGLKRLRSKSAKSVQVYACSFCRDGDLLSQWRGYGINNGYSLGFSGDVLRQRAKENGDRFFRVEYGAQEGAELLDAIREGIAYGGSLPPWGLALIKDPSFREEQEWRWVCDVEESKTEGPEKLRRRRTLNYRAGNLGVIPYLVFGAPREALRKVIVGPGQHPEVREEGVRHLLNSRGYKSVKVKSSGIPIRL